MGDTSYHAMKLSSSGEYELHTPKAEEFDEEFLEGTTFPVIKLNGGYKSIQTERISYERILEMLGVQGKQEYTVTYFTRDRGIKGSLSPGESIATIDRLIINADRTDNA